MGLISVVVCTYNRSALLRTCLESLVAQDVAPGSYEVIVVDNNSTDDTRATMGEIAASYPHVRYAFEPRQGLSHARNRGARESRGDYVAYVDDECKVPLYWISTANAIAERLAPAMFGGPYAPWYDRAKPQWFKDEYAGTSTRISEARALSSGEFVSGGNMFVARNVLNMLGGFDPEFGMSGGKLGYAEETAFQMNLRAMAPDALIYFDPALLIYHLVRPEKMKLAHAFRSHLADGEALGRLRPRRDRSPFQTAVMSSVKIAGAACLLGWQASIGVLMRNRLQCPCAYSHLYERAFPYARVMGTHWSQLQRVIARRPSRPAPGNT